MEKLDLLSNISTKDLSIGDITNFFEQIKNVKDIDTTGAEEYIVPAANLRADEVKACSDEEKALIMKNFPASQGTYLVVPKVIQG